MLILLVKTLAVWIILVILAILNGTFRQKLLIKFLSELRAHQASSVIFSVIIFLLSLTFVRTQPQYDNAAFAKVGVLWLAMTIGFEFIFGHFVMKHPWRILLADYNLAKGRVWVLVLIVTLTAPVVCALWFR
jgi:hypothetical protein